MPCSPEARRLATIHRDDYALSTALNIEGQVALLADDLPTAPGVPPCARHQAAHRRPVGMTYSPPYLGRLAQIERNDAEAPRPLQREHGHLPRHRRPPRHRLRLAQSGRHRLPSRREYAEAEWFYQASWPFTARSAREAGQSLSRLARRRWRSRRTMLPSYCSLTPFAWRAACVRRRP